MNVKSTIEVIKFGSFVGGVCGGFEDNTEIVGTLYN